MKQLITLIAFALVAFTANAQTTLKGDVNGDGEVNVTDVTMIVEYVLGQHNSSFIVANADVNGDGNITVTDVAEAVNIILDGNGGNTPQSYLTCPDNNHPHMIDLGLPSGTLWACCNVGATKPEEYGGYYAWGETEEKSVYNEVTSLYCSGVDNNGDGYYDYDKATNTYGQWQSLGDDIAGTQYDVAHVQWGGSWVMPSFAQIKELRNKCSYKWTTMDGIEGVLFIGPNGGNIFLPAAGYRSNFLYSDGGAGGYLSSTQHRTDMSETCTLDIAIYDGVNVEVYCFDDGFREFGQSVRPVCVMNNTPFELLMKRVEVNVGEIVTMNITLSNGSYIIESTDNNVALVSLSGTTITITGIAVGSSEVIVTDTDSGREATVEVTVKGPNYCPDNNHPHMIDLGLPSGTLWACCNVGATKPEEYGGYYAWGETEEKSVYNEVTYQYCTGEDTDGDGFYEYIYYKDPPSLVIYQSLGSDIAGTQYDVAHVKWGGSWVMPSLAQIQELLDNCSFTKTAMFDIYGEKFTGPNGSTIFLPSAGIKYRLKSFTSEGGYRDLIEIGTFGRYWSSTPYPSDSYFDACALNFYSDSRSGYPGDAHWYHSDRYDGFTVRPVSK